MNKRILHTLAAAVLLLTGCHDSKRDAIGQTEVLIETSEGDIVVRLYDDTPLHRDNFIKNVEESKIGRASCRERV